MSAIVDIPNWGEVPCVVPGCCVLGFSGVRLGDLPGSMVDTSPWLSMSLITPLRLHGLVEHKMPSSFTMTNPFLVIIYSSTLCLPYLHVLQPSVIPSFGSVSDSLAFTSTTRVSRQTDFHFCVEHSANASFGSNETFRIGDDLFRLK